MREFLTVLHERFDERFYSKFGKSLGYGFQIRSEAIDPKIVDQSSKF